MSIAIEVNNEYLDLPKDLSINFKIRNNIFFKKVIPNTITYNFTLPVGGNFNKNKRVLEFVNHIDVVNNIGKEYDAKLYIDNVLFQIGTLKVKDASEESIKAVFKSSKNELTKLENISLRDIDYGQKSFDYDVCKAAIGVYWELTSGETAAIKINGTVYSASYNGSTLQTIKDLGNNINNANNELTAYGVSVSDNTTGNIENLLTVEDTKLDRALSFDLNISQNTATTSNFKWHYDKNNSPKFRKGYADQLDGVVDQFYPFVSAYYPQADNPNVTSYKINTYDKSSSPAVVVTNDRVYREYGYLRPIEADMLSAGHNISQKTVILSPFISVLFILKKLFNYIGYDPGGDFFEDNHIKGLCIANNYGIYVDGKENNDLTINYNNQIPDVDAITFIKDLALKLFNLNIEEDVTNKQIKLNYIENIFNNRNLKTLDISNKATKGYNLLNNDQHPFKFSFKEPTEDQFIEDNLLNEQRINNLNLIATVDDYSQLPSNPAGDEIALVKDVNAYFIGGNWSLFSYDYFKYTPISSEKYDKIKAQSFPMPISGNRAKYKTKINAVNKGDGVNTLGLRFTFYRGFVNNKPFASPDIYDDQGNEIAQYALRYHRDKGLYDQFWKFYSDFLLNAKVVEQRYALSINDLLNIKSNTQLIDNGRRFYWKEMTGKISNKNGLQPVKLKLLKT